MNFKKAICVLYFAFPCIFAEPQPVLQDAHESPEFKIVYGLDGGVNAPQNPQSYKSWRGAKLFPPTKRGYVFSGWYTAFNFTGERITEIEAGETGAKRLYAKFVAEFSPKNPVLSMATVIPEGKKVTVENLFAASGIQTLYAYEIGKYEVTLDLYTSVTGKNPRYRTNDYYEAKSVYDFVKDKSMAPVINVTWFDGAEFCNKLTERLLGASECVYTIKNAKYDKFGFITSADVTADYTKNGYRMPTIFEYEFAARGGTKGGWDYKYSGSDNPDDVWTNPDPEYFAVHATGTKKPNSLGIYDMSGNVAEFADCPEPNHYAVLVGSDRLSEIIKPPFTYSKSEHAHYTGSLRLCRTLGKVTHASAEPKFKSKKEIEAEQKAAAEASRKASEAESRRKEAERRMMEDLEGL